MVSPLSQTTSIQIPKLNIFFNSRTPHHVRLSHPKVRPSLHNTSVKRPRAISSFASNNQNQKQQYSRTLFPGGYKRPEIRVPNIVLELSSEELLNDKTALDVIDEAVVDRVGIVVLNGGEGSGGKLYEAACLLKSVVRDRAYLVIAERVDIAAAVNANGVLLSDQGLPSIVARNTMMDSKSDSVFLPLVARNVRTSDAAANASKFEGADFLIYVMDGERDHQELVSSVFESVKIPVFYKIDLFGDEKLFKEASMLLESGASGLVMSLEDLVSLNDDLTRKFCSALPLNNRPQEKLQNFEKHKILNEDNGFPGKKGFAGFMKLEDRE